MDRSYLFVIPALFIDGLQAGMSFGLSGMFAAPNAIPLVGQFVGTALAPVGILLGLVVAFCISMTLGAGFLLLLAMHDMFYPEYAFLGMLGEIIPGINNLPLWTGLAWRCARRKTQENRAHATTTEGVREKEPEQEEKQEQTARKSPVDGIRAAQKIAAVFVTLAFFGTGTVALAQASDPVQFIVAPELPGPNETVLIEAQGVGTFLGDANITWQKDGKTEKSGRGERTYSFIAGALGSFTRISVTITSGSTGTITRDFTFRPSVVNLVWEADTYTPPFYRGKALYTAGSPLKIIAFPTIVVNGSAVSANSLSFQWSRNNEPVSSASGIGRYIFSFEGDQLRQSEIVGVEVFWGTTKVARGSITIPASSPQVLLYNRDPLRGILYDTALPQAIALLGKEITLQAESYFFSNTSRSSGSLLYLWAINGQETTGPDTSRGILTLRQTGQGSGSAALSVSVQDTDAERLVQQASANLQIVFGQQQSNSLFSELSAAVSNFSQGAQVYFGAQPNVVEEAFRDFSGPSPGTFLPYRSLPSTNPAFGPTPPGTGNLPPYQPLEPIPGLPQGGAVDFGQLLSAVFRILISVGALFAVVMLTIAGIEYMVSEVPGVKSWARDHAWGAIIGLLILVGSVLILQTINPQLVNFSNLLNPVPVKVGITETEPRGGIYTRKLTENEKRLATNSYGGSGLFGRPTLVWDSLVYNSADTTNKTVREELEKFKQYCESRTWNVSAGGSFLLGGVPSLVNELSRGRIATVPGDAAGLPGQEVQLCVNAPFLGIL